MLKCDEWKESVVVPWVWWGGPVWGADRGLWVIPIFVFLLIVLHVFCLFIHSISTSFLWLYIYLGLVPFGSWLFLDLGQIRSLGYLWSLNKGYSIGWFLFITFVRVTSKLLILYSNIQDSASHCPLHPCHLAKPISCFLSWVCTPQSVRHILLSSFPQPCFCSWFPFT